MINPFVSNKEIDKKLNEFMSQLQELKYEHKLVNKDKNLIELDKKILEEELVKIRTEEFLKNPNYERLYKNVDLKSSTNMSGFLKNSDLKSSVNMSAYSTLMSLQDFKKDLDDRKKIIVYMNKEVSVCESQINDSKKRLKEKSVLSQKLVKDNSDLKDRHIQKDLIIKQLKQEIGSLKDTLKEKKLGIVNEEIKLPITNYYSQRDQDTKITPTNINEKPPETKQNITKEKKGFLGFVKSIFGKKK